MFSSNPHRAVEAEVLAERVADLIARGTTKLDFEDTVERPLVYIARVDGLLMDKDWHVIGEVQVSVTVPKSGRDKDAQVRVAWIKAMHTIWWTKEVVIRGAIGNPWRVSLSGVHPVLFDMRLSALNDIRSSTLNNRYLKVSNRGAWFYKSGRRHRYIF